MCGGELKVVERRNLWRTKTAIFRLGDKEKEVLAILAVGCRRARMSCSCSDHLCFLQGVDMSAIVRRGGGQACPAGQMPALSRGGGGEVGNLWT